MKEQFTWISHVKKSEGKQNETHHDYLRIIQQNSQISHGGNQMWWSGKKGGDAKRISRMGCGVIAMNDLESFLIAPEMQKEDYEKQVDASFQKRYRIKNAPINNMVGLYPWTMEKGLQAFFDKNGIFGKTVKWAPYWKKGAREQKRLVLQAIKTMLDNGFPVVCSYHAFEKRNYLNLYSRPEDAANQFQNAETRKTEKVGQRSGFVTIGSHYMTIIGILRDAQDRYYLQFESWGRIYFAAYDSYAKNLTYFTNILYIS